MRAQFAPQRPPRLDEEREIDRLVRHAHRQIIRIGAAQPPRDLLRRPPLLELFLDHITQRRFERQLAALRPPCPAPRRLIGVVRPVALAAPVTADLPRNRAVTAPDPRRDRPTALTARQATRDLLTLPLRETPLRARPRRRLHSTRRGDIPTHVLRPGAELTRHPPQRGPITPQLPNPLLLALGQPEPSHRGDHLHQPGSQASRPDVQVVHRPPESATVCETGTCQRCRPCAAGAPPTQRILSWHCDHPDRRRRTSACRRNQSSRRGRRRCPAQARRRS